MHHAVVDTSVLISAFLFPASPPGHLIDLARQRRFVLHMSTIIKDEFYEALSRDRLRQTYRYEEADIADWWHDLAEIACLIPDPLPDIGPVCRDPDDDHVIAAAMVTNATWIVTGDKDLLAIGRYRQIEIVKVRAFVDSIVP